MTHHRRIPILVLLVLIAATSAISLNARAADSSKDVQNIDPYNEYARANKLAASGALTRSIPHYEKVIKAAPEKFPLAYFNLAEVWRAKGRCNRAVLLYEVFLALGNDPSSKGEAHAGIKQCVAKGKWGKLSATVTPTARSTITVDGHILAKAGNITSIYLRTGEHTITAQAKDYVPQTQKVSVKKGQEASAEFKLKKMTFYGTFKIDVDQAGATVTLTPKKMDNPDAPTKVITLTTPVKKPIKLATGKYFLQVTKPNFGKWIRNIYVTRGQESSVKVEMQHLLPAEIR